MNALAAPDPPKELARVRIERMIYGGFGLGRTPGTEAAAPRSLLVPFTLPGELVDVVPAAAGGEALLQTVVEASPQRVAPGCPHFGVCGGCHLQMAQYSEQLAFKREVLLDSLQRAGVADPPTPEVHPGEPWGYRNRIRLRLERVDGVLRLGYTQRGHSQAFLPIATCPIAAPLLWRAAEALLATAARSPELARILALAREIELFTDAELSRLQLTLLCPPLPKAAQSTPRVQAQASFERAMSALQAEVPELTGAAAVQASWRPLRLGPTLASFGAQGLAYTVSWNGHQDRFWIAPGGFFQVNRFLIPTLVDLVCRDREGKLVWDLFAGAGLFARPLSRSFDRVTAVEAHPGSAEELRKALSRAGPQHATIASTTLAFLQHALLQRDRPDLIVLDPPRAGAGEEVCALLLRVAAAEIMYVSCHPMTLGRDLAILQSTYSIRALHLVDLFPQTYHQEAVVTLSRRA